MEGRTYQIRVEGILGPEWADWFDGLTIEPRAMDESVLTVPAADQAYLRGILTRLWDRNLTLISLVSVEGEGTGR